MTQFVGCTIGRLSVGKVMKSLLPFYSALIAVLIVAVIGVLISALVPRWFRADSALMLVTCVPAFLLWLPGLFKWMSE